MRLVWAIKDYSCLQGPGMFMASYAGYSRAQDGGNQTYSSFDSHEMFATNLSPSHSHLADIPAHHWEPKSPHLSPSTTFVWFSRILPWVAAATVNTVKEVFQAAKIVTGQPEPHTWMPLSPGSASTGREGSYMG